MSRNSGSAKELWSVWRQDDNGISFEVARGLSNAGATEMVKKFEQRGHKQVYWVDQDDGGRAEEGRPTS